MIEFLTENWKLIAILGAILVDLILVLVLKKKPVVALYDNSFYYNLSTWIEEAEKSLTVGSEKLAYVLGKAKVYLGKQFDEKAVTNIVEWILTLPEKKEGKKNEK